MSQHDATTGADLLAARAQRQGATDEAEAERQGKAIATLKARCAIAGYELHVVAARDGRRSFLARRWGRTIDLPDEAAVGRWLEQVGAP